MRILLLAHAFNGLTQRLFAELESQGHEVTLELDISDQVSLDAVALFRPQLVVASFLKRAIPAAIYEQVTCLVVHPGIVGDRGPSALERALRRGEPEWGVTVLQATAVLDGGPIWAEARFNLPPSASGPSAAGQPRPMRKSLLYRTEVTEAACRALAAAIERFIQGDAPVPPALWHGQPGCAWPALTQSERQIDWGGNRAVEVAAAIAAADGAPGVHSQLFGVPCALFDAVEEPAANAWMDALGWDDHPPGAVLAQHEESLLVRTVDGGVWVGQVRVLDGGFKLPAAVAFAGQAGGLAQFPGTAACPSLHYDDRDEPQGVGWLAFPFYNGAMSTAQCRRLASAVRQARERPIRVLVLAGGAEFFSNGIHLNVIEQAASPAEESLRNIEAMNDVVLEILRCESLLTISALRGNAAAGGVFLALAADLVWAHRGVVLNPSYKNMGNLYGSEYWTYLLPRRMESERGGGAAGVARVTGRRTPLLARVAAEEGLIDEVFATGPVKFELAVRERAYRLAGSRVLPERLAIKRGRRASDEAVRPLADYRAAELAEMRRNFFGFDPSYHVARANFVRKTPPAWTPRHLARHRDRPAS